LTIVPTINCMQNITFTQFPVRCNFSIRASRLRKKEFLIVIDLKSSGTLVNVKIDDFTIEQIF
jgi:hypothetical protein